MFQEDTCHALICLFMQFQRQTDHLRVVICVQFYAAVEQIHHMLHQMSEKQKKFGRLFPFGKH